jgi:hypothetical protein
VNYSPFVLVGYVSGGATGRRVHALVTQDPKDWEFAPCGQSGIMYGEPWVFVDGPPTCGRCLRLLREQPHRHCPSGLGWPYPGQGRPFGRAPAGGDG